MAEPLAIFPLDTVVFPGMTVPLRAFEARYKRLVRYTVARDPQRFVVARPVTAASSSEAVGLGDGFAQSVEGIGSFVDVLRIQEQDDGSFWLLGHGRERCRVRVVQEEAVPEPSGGTRPLYFTDEDPYPLQRGDPNEERVAAWDALDAFRTFADETFPRDARRKVESAIPDEPFYQASFVCANLHLPAVDAQDLLEAPTLSDRFGAARRAIARLRGAPPDPDARSEGP